MLKKNFLIFLVLLNINPVGADTSQNILRLQTDTYFIEIHGRADNDFTYYSWKKKSYNKDKPDLILLNGAMDYDGSGGNISYTFRNGTYTYEIYQHVIGTEFTPPYSLSVYDNNKLILNQPAHPL